MGGSPKKRTRFCIYRPQGKLSIDMEKNHGLYTPIAESSNIRKKQSLPQKPDTKVKLKCKTTPNYKKLVKKLQNNSGYSEACSELCMFPTTVEGAESAASLLLLVLLSQATHLLCEHLPQIPILQLNVDASATLPVLQVLLTAIQGPEQWKGADWKLRRPWVVSMKSALGQTKPSADIYNYFGGLCHDENGRTRKFCFPAVDSSVILMPGLPPTIAKWMIEFSPMAIPIVFRTEKQSSNRSILKLNAEHLDSYDKKQLDSLKRLEGKCHKGIMVFLAWFCEKKKHIRNWSNDIESFRPTMQKGRYQQVRVDGRTNFLCAALAFFKQYLYFASEEVAWITEEQAHEYLLRYWSLVLPESAPLEDGTSKAPPELAYGDAATFYQFLVDQFLPTYSSQILNASSGSPGTMGLFHMIDRTHYFISPRKEFLDTYRKWLEECGGSVFPLGGKNDEASVQGSLRDAGVPLKRESGNQSTWRYKFYKKGTVESGLEKVACIALPIQELPEQVQEALRELFGSAVALPSKMNSSEVEQKDTESVEPL